MPTSLITWYFYGMAGLGGWAIFFLLALSAVAWTWYDSLKRSLSAWGWRIGIVILTGMLMPSFLYRFTVSAAQFTDYFACILGARSADYCVNTLSLPPLAPYYEVIFYLGLLAGLLAIAISVAYYINYQGVVGRSTLMPGPSNFNVQVAYPAPPMMRPAPPQMPPPPAAPPHQQPVAPQTPRSLKQPLAAWLVARDGHNYQLFANETSIGRSAENDIFVSGDTTVSQHHAKITEQNGHFRLIDLGSTNGTRVNGKWVRQPILLEPNDEIEFGDNTLVRFITGR